MGISGASQILYSCKISSLEELNCILRHRAAARGCNTNPSILLDASTLAHKLSTETSSAVPQIVHLCETFIELGISVTVVFNNEKYQHHPKKATILRNRKAEQS